MTKNRWGIYSECRFPKPLLAARPNDHVAVWCAYPCPNMAHYMIGAFAAIAIQQQVSELHIFYRARRIKNDVIQSIDLA